MILVHPKRKMRRLEQKGDAREQVRLQKQAVRQDRLRQAETTENRILRLHGQALRQQCMR